MTPEEPKHITFVGDSSGWSLSADGTETRWETSGPDGHLGDENRRLRERVAALEGALSTTYKGIAAIIADLDKDEVSEDDISSALSIAGNMMERRVKLPD